jgi:uncharacterized membrane protein
MNVSRAMAVLSVAGGCATAAWAQNAQLRALGVLDDRVRPAASVAHGLSSDGRWIVGGSHIDAAGSPQMQACRWEWSGAEPTAPMPMMQHSSFGSVAKAISDDGTVAAGSAGLVFEFFDGFHYMTMEGLAWFGIGGFIPTTSTFDSSYEMTDVTRDGSLFVGSLRDPMGWDPAPGQAVLWSSGTLPFPLGTLAGSGISVGHACSGDGAVVVGASHNASGIVTSFDWALETGMVQMPGLPIDNFHEAHGVSGNGLFVVGGLIGDSYVWSRAAGTMTTIARTPGTGWSFAEDVTNDGALVVGHTVTDSENGHIYRAFVWDPSNGTRTVEQYLASLGVDATGWTFLRVNAVSDDGRTLVGEAITPGGTREGWALRIGGSSCGSADFDGDGDAGTDADIEAFFACLGGECCRDCGSADFDGDGDTGTDADIEAFFRVLGGGTC